MGRNRIRAPGCKMDSAPNFHSTAVPRLLIEIATFGHILNSFSTC